MADPLGRQEVDIFETMEKTNWAKNMTKAITHFQMMIKEKGIDAPLDYTDLNFDEDVEPLPQNWSN